MYAYLRACVCEFLVASALVLAKQVLGFHVLVRMAMWTRLGHEQVRRRKKKKKKQTAFKVRKCRANKTCKQKRKKRSGGWGGEGVGEGRHAGFYRQSKHTHASTQTFTLNTAQRTIY